MEVCVMKKQRKTKIIDGQICSVRGVPLTRCSNTLTERQFVAFILSGLRRLTKYWKPKLDKMIEGRRAYTGTDKRTKWEFQCYTCKKWFKQKDIEMDHIYNCAGLADLADVPRWIEQAFCEKDGYQILCKPCHLQKTKTERLLQKMTDDSQELGLYD